MLYIIRSVRATRRAHLILLDILALYALKRIFSQLRLHSIKKHSRGDFVESLQ